MKRRAERRLKRHLVHSSSARSNLAPCCMCAHCFLSYCCTQGPHHPAAGRVNCITQSISLHYCETGPHDPAVEPVERHAHQSLLGARLRGEAQLLHCWHNLGPCSGRIAAVWPPRGAAHLHGYEVRRGLVKFNRRLALHSAAAKLCCRPGHSFKYDAAAAQRQRQQRGQQRQLAVLPGAAA